MAQYRRIALRNSPYKLYSFVLGGKAMTMYLEDVDHEFSDAFLEMYGAEIVEFLKKVGSYKKK